MVSGTRFIVTPDLRFCGVPFAQLRRPFVIQKRQECIASSGRNARYPMQKRAGKHHSPAERNLKTFWAVFGKAEVAAVEVVIQVGRDCETAMRRSGCRIVAMGLEMAPLRSRVARNDVTF